MDNKITPADAITGLTAAAVGRALQRGEFSTAEVLKAVRARISEIEPLTHSYISLYEDEGSAMAEAAQKKIDAARADGTLSSLSSLTGVPLAVKDNICVKGQVTTCGSHILDGHKPVYDGTVISRLRDAGTVIIGKTNMDEFAMGSTTETSCYPATANPHDLSRSPGGSSGGSAAAVAAFEAFAALGSDTGGSIRQPASFCGVAGLKPTYGAVSRYGLVAFASSLDQIGPMGRTVEDCALLYDLVQGHDPRDSTSISSEFTLPDLSDQASSKPLDGLRIGIPDEYFGEGLQTGVRDTVLAAVTTLENLGATCESFSLPILAFGVPAYYILACAEASSNLARYDGVKYGFRAAETENLTDLYIRTRSEGFGLEAKRRIMLGNFVLSSGYYDAYYDKAMRVRAKVVMELDSTFSRYDMLLGPVAPEVAPKLGESLQDPLAMYLGDIYTVAANLAGLPALSVPCGVSEGLPVGLQLIGPGRSESTLLRTGHFFEGAVNI